MNRVALLCAQLKGLSFSEFIRTYEALTMVEEDFLNESLKIKKTLTEIFKKNAFSFEQSSLIQSVEDFYVIEEALEKEKISYFTYFDEQYPTNLKNISGSPRILYYKGNIQRLYDDRKIGIVGTRKPTMYGIWATKKFAQELVQNNFCIISGMATGVDGHSHEEAIANDGYTICVLGGSIHKPYPKSNIKLMEKVIQGQGLILSEYSPISPTLPGNFAARNRIISGLSDGVLIIEAGMKSGTLITADFALEQGKPIFAIPGNINSKYSVGTNGLIKQGAVVATDIYDILQEFQYEFQQNSAKKDYVYMQLSEIEKKIIDCITQKGTCHIEQIAISTNFNIKDIAGVMNILDLKGLIHYDGHMASIC